MKKDIYTEAHNYYIQNRKHLIDEFFIDRTIEIVNDDFVPDRNEYNRILSKEESAIITTEAFELLLFWVQIGELEIEQFERFMSKLVTFSGRIFEPIDREIATAMMEMMRILDFEEHVIRTTIELHVESPTLFRYSFNVEH